MARATRDAYGHLLETELYKNPRIVVLDADLGSAGELSAEIGCVEKPRVAAAGTAQPMPAVAHPTSVSVRSASKLAAYGSGKVGSSSR